MKELSQEIKDKIKTLPRIDFEAYQELIKTKQILQIVKLRTPRTIFYDESTNLFLYFNKFHLNFCKCGKFSE